MAKWWEEGGPMENDSMMAHDFGVMRRSMVLPLSWVGNYLYWVRLQLDNCLLNGRLELLLTGILKSLRRIELGLS